MEWLSYELIWELSGLTLRQLSIRFLVEACRISGDNLVKSTVSKADSLSVKHIDLLIYPFIACLLCATFLIFSSEYYDVVNSLSSWWFFWEYIWQVYWSCWSFAYTSNPKLAFGSCIHFVHHTTTTNNTFWGILNRPTELNITTWISNQTSILSISLYQSQVREYQLRHFGRSADFGEDSFMVFCCCLNAKWSWYSCPLGILIPRSWVTWSIHSTGKVISEQAHQINLSFSNYHILSKYKSCALFSLSVP